MKKNKGIPNIIWFTFLVIYSELIYKHFVFKNVLSINSLKVILFSLPFILIFYIISNIYSDKANKVISKILSFVITLIFAAQYVYYAFYESIFSVYSLTAGTAQVFGFWEAIIDMIVRNWVGVVLLFLPTLIYIILGGKFINYKRFKKCRIIISLVLFVICYSFCFIYIKYLATDGMYSINNLYYNTHAPMLTVNKTGLLTMEKLDIKRYLFGFEEKTDINIIKKEIVIEPKIEYNMLDIDFESLINNETDETIKTLHNYFSSVMPTEKNEYTGMFEGKNLVYITAEGFDSIAVDPVLTPTLYKLANNGFVFKNYYQPLYTVSTSDGEYMNMVSFLPKEGIWSMYRSSNLYFPYALGNVFKNLGYNSRAYHDHTYSYYHRDKSHPNLGFDYLGCGNGLEKRMNCRRWPSSDVDMINATYSDYINDEKFLTYYMTVSGHLNYTFVGNTQASNNRSLVKDLPYSSNVQAYLACNIELDRALEKLMNYLQEIGKLDDTVFVMGPDHYPYGLTVSEINEKSSENRDDKFNLYHTTLVIYNSAMEKNVEVDKYVTSIDILPTVYNLFGINYDSRLLMGTDALSNSEGLVMLSDRSWINENGSYNSITGEFKAFNEEHNNQEYIDSINNKVSQKFSVSSMIFTQKNGKYIDYFRTLGI